MTQLLLLRPDVYSIIRPSSVLEQKLDMSIGLIYLTQNYKILIR